MAIAQWAGMQQPTKIIVSTGRRGGRWRGDADGWKAWGSLAGIDDATLPTYIADISAGHNKVTTFWKYGHLLATQCFFCHNTSHHLFLLSRHLFFSNALSYFPVI
jgi:hypothetical protein